MSGRNIGEEVSLDINIQSDQNVVGFEFILNYAPDSLEFIEVQLKDYLPAGAFTVPPKVEQGKILYSAVAIGNSAVKTEGVLATVRFKILQAKAVVPELAYVKLSEPNLMRIETTLSTPLILETGWNMISIPGQPLDADPNHMQAEDRSLILTFYQWNPAAFSYEPVTELKFGKGYWALTTNVEGTLLQIPIINVDSYQETLKSGWNMIGSATGTISFADPIDEPANSIVTGSLYSWNPANFSYQAETEIRPGQGYWVLALEDCQLTVGGKVNVPTAPQVLAEPEVLLALKLSSDDWNQQLELGMDPSSRDSLDPMDRPIPPSGPIEVEHQAYLVGEPYRLRRDIRSASEKGIRWQIRLSSPDPVRLNLGSQQIPTGKELIIADGQIEQVIIAGMEIELDSGD